MLSYAFKILKQSNYDEVASEKFENAQDLFAAILSKGIAQQLKQGLYREYVYYEKRDVIHHERQAGPAGDSAKPDPAKAEVGL